MCRVYRVTRAGYYAWRKRPASARRQQDERLIGRIRRIHADSRGTYGSPRVHDGLRDEGERVSAKRVARLMRENDIQARSARLYRSHAALKAFHCSVPNRSLGLLLDAPDRVWVGDVTYLWVGDCWRYLAVVMDRYSRRIIGWSYGNERNTRLTLRALNYAIQNRRPRTGLIFHTDRGIEYSAQVFRDRLAAVGIVQSMNRPREMNDNAHMESFFGTMKADVIHGERFQTDPAVRRVCHRGRLLRRWPRFDGRRVGQRVDAHSDDSRRV